MENLNNINIKYVYMTRKCRRTKNKRNNRPIRKMDKTIDSCKIRRFIVLIYNLF